MTPVTVPTWKGPHFLRVQEVHTASEELKQGFTTACLTVLPRPWLAFHCGSRYLWATGAILSQNLAQSRSHDLMSFSSRQHTLTERNYDIWDTQHLRIKAASEEW